jgi:soluble lytic murein transglycosylase
MQRVCSVAWILAVMATAQANPPEARSQAAGSREPAELARLQTLLAQREAELEAIRGRVRALDEEERWLADAESLGIVGILRLSALTERAQRRVAITVVREARANGLDPLLVVAVIRSESGFRPYAVSWTGAMGLMQIVPTTGTLLATQRGTSIRHRQTLFDAELNIELGTAYLAALLREFGTTEAALVAYNAGPSAARRVLRSPELRRTFVAGYPRTVINEWRRLWSVHTAMMARRDLGEAAHAVAASRLSTAQ